MRNNPVYNVFATKGNRAVAPKGTTLDGLTIGQIGVFNRATNLAIGATDTGIPEIYLALAVEKNGVKDIVTSAGQFIQSQGVKNLTAQCYEAGLSKIVKFSNMTSVNGTDYTMKFAFMNGDLLSIDGYQLPTKTYSVRPINCTAACNPCPDEVCNVLPVMFYDEISQDSDGLLTVKLVDPNDAEVLRENADAWIAANPTKCLSLVVSAVKESIYKFCCINIHYNYLRETDFEVALQDGFTCSKTTLKVVQAVQYAQGEGYDIAQDEYFADGWEGKPGVYRVSSIFGLPLGDYNFQADTSAKYVQINLLHDLDSISGWNHYQNNLETLIAVPCGDNTTLTGLAALLDGWISNNVKKGIKPIAAEVGTCTC